LDNKIFHYLIQFLRLAPIDEFIDANYFKEVARTMEFCSTHTEGINLLFSN